MDGKDRGARGSQVYQVWKRPPFRPSARHGHQVHLEKVSYDTDEIWERYFNVGDRVRLYKNAKIIVKANPAPDDENLMCPLCGAMVCRPVCLFCGVDFTEAPPSLSAENPSAE